MNHKAKIIPNIVLPGILTISGVASIIAIATTTATSALTYSSDTDVSFTFNPTLSISLSNANINIDNLLPGLSSESSPITVHVNSNTPYGYSLFASVGNSTEYNTTSLTHEDSSTGNNAVFTSIATNASLPQLDTDNTWGYSFSNDNGTTWSNYNGLPLYSTVGNNTSTNNPALLIDTKSPADSTESIDFKIAAKASATQASGTYNNVINFYAVGKPAPLTLYEEVAKMSKGTQTVADLQSTITAPTSVDRAEDTSNSGVYEYNSAVFGESSDASNTNKIYYYRGILEPEADQGAYGSDGKATTYPNYVRLGNDTCWRIVRTTGSGGVKMIYNGTWTGSTCANNRTNAQLTTSPFNDSSATVAGKSYTGLQYRNMHAIGYTYSNVAANTTASTALSTLLGATGDDTTTNTNSSIIKQYIEDWYSTNMVNSTNNYTSILEESAGYCNDRSVYNSGSYAASTVLPDSTTVIPYGLKKMTQYYFGAYTRNLNTAQTPSFTCPRGIVDIYSTTTTSGGNGQLAQPIAFLTVDELSFTGSNGEYTSYNYHSFLSTGSQFWLLSPYQRAPGGIAHSFKLGEASSGSIFIGQYAVYNYSGLRPVISLKPGTTVASGTGIATDPWIINE